MKNIYFKLALFTLIIASCNKINNDSQDVFIKSNFNDTLGLFISQMTEIPNPYEAPTICLITFECNDNDTIMYFQRCIGFEVVDYKNFINMNDPKTLEYYPKMKIAGGCMVNNTPVIFLFVGIENLDSILNSEVLSMDFARENDFFSNYDGPDYYDWEYRTKRKAYKLVKNDSLIFISYSY